MMNKIIHEVRCPRIQNTHMNNPRPMYNNMNQSRSIPQIQSGRALLPYVDNFRHQIGQNGQLIKCFKCNKEVNQENLRNHKKYECDADKIPCEFCQTVILPQFYQEHVENCQKNSENINPDNLDNFIIPCENCDQMVNAGVYERHLQSCTGIQDSNLETQIDSQQTSDSVVCEICGNQVISRDYNSHVQSHVQQNNSYSQNQVQQTNLSNNFLGNDPFFNSRSSNVNIPGGLMMTMSGPGVNFMSMSSGQGMQQSTNIISSQGQQIIEEIRTDPNGNVQRILRISPSGNHISQSIMINNGNIQEMRSTQSSLGFFNSGSGMNVMELMQNIGSRGRGLNQEIVEGLATARFDKENSQNLDEEAKKCSVCITEFEDEEMIKFLPCTHRFHGQCIDTWLRDHSTCPLCKRDFRNLSH